MVAESIAANTFKIDRVIFIDMTVLQYNSMEY